MKIKLLASSLLMAGAMMASGTASADTIFSGTLAQWIGQGTIRDNDNDMDIKWETASGDILANLGVWSNWIDVAMVEQEVGAVDYYSIEFAFNPDEGSPFAAQGGYSTNGGDFRYSLITVDTDETINSVRLDSDVLDNVERITKDVYDKDPALGGTLLLPQLVSDSGVPDPNDGSHYHFAPSSSVYVVDTLSANGGLIYSTSNQFDVETIPEPMTLTLMGIGLAAFGARRRFA
jgi:hypothetical protein